MARKRHRGFGATAGSAQAETAVENYAATGSWTVAGCTPTTCTLASNGNTQCIETEPDGTFNCFNAFQITIQSPVNLCSDSALALGVPGEETVTWSDQSDSTSFTVPVTVEALAGIIFVYPVSPDLTKGVLLGGCAGPKTYSLTDTLPGS